MREARIRVAAEWRPVDLQSVLELLSTRKLELGGLITHERPFDQASEAYATAFADPGCLKMLIDWSSCP
jgi:3-hydroxyethyl bacteriochlorophyllide a dehydrogenase